METPQRGTMALNIFHKAFSIVCPCSTFFTKLFPLSALAQHFSQSFFHCLPLLNIFHDFFHCLPLLNIFHKTFSIVCPCSTFFTKLFPLSARCFNIFHKAFSIVCPYSTFFTKIALSALADIVCPCSTFFELFL